MRLKKERLLKSNLQNEVRDSMELLKQQEESVLHPLLDYEKWHVESRKENFSLFSQQPNE
jgi:hypothetical protein